MNRVLRKGPGGFITRDQWVLSGYCKGRKQYDYAFFTQYLWDFGPPVVHGGFAADDEHRMRAEMLATAKMMVEELQKEIMEGLKSRENFAIGPTFESEIEVTFHRHETEGHLYRIVVRKAGQQPITIEDDFSENWEAGEVGWRVEDAMMLVAARDPSDAPVEEDEHPEPTLGELLGDQLHAISTRNLMPHGNRVLGEILAEKLGELAGPVIAAMEEAQAVIVEDPMLVKPPKTDSERADGRRSDSYDPAAVSAD